MCKLNQIELGAVFIRKFDNDQKTIIAVDCRFVIFRTWGKVFKSDLNEERNYEFVGYNQTWKNDNKVD